MLIPSHVGIIMDGNGRWAKERGLPRREGHLAGINALESVLRRAELLGIPCLTVYAFSTENWKRPGMEVKFLLQLFEETLLNRADELFKNNVKVKVIGRREGLPSNLIETIKKIEEKTRNNKAFQLNIAFNYGGRAEIIDLVSSIVRDIQEGKKIDLNDEKTIANYLYSPEYPEVELLIRTSGEKRLSNFLLWQSAYAELYFTDKYWPDFDGDELEKAIEDFKKRNRRFGGLNEEGGG
ncbi:MAG TPA: isoprenyl transferase [Halanaerobiaceae bacterium]|jgi:undecaprenyl diphosphate synthase|nr:isoprenyl transferase [Bacillota bacterium]HHU91704.1 isoprenyl transferase [Halanaerobiaceae bacterium]HOA40415.1 isoprenyl transferase [Halanaerobiales bacterium]HPZ62561.1 isoprenyl transferase [Halanaerobiales bacterium]HQD03143.1 isoprenyl transferase [Halanaerobiales bacterium]